MWKLKNRSKSEEAQHEIKEELKNLGLERRDFLKLAGASVMGGVGTLFLPGISKATVKTQTFTDMEADGQTVSVLPAWTPYPYEVVGLPVLDAGVPEGFFTYLMNYDKILPIYCGAFYISGVKGQHILVDSGPTKKDFTDKGYPCKEISPCEKQLKDMVGITPKDIDMVIYTHMHHDHNPLARLYTNAKHIIQKTDWNMLHNPPACYRHLLNPEYMTGVAPTFVHGDVVNLLPGISLLYTPGHTPRLRSRDLPPPGMALRAVVFRLLMHLVAEPTLHLPVVGVVGVPPDLVLQMLAAGPSEDDHELGRRGRGFPLGLLRGRDLALQIEHEIGVASLLFHAGDQLVTQ